MNVRSPWPLLALLLSCDPDGECAEEKPWEECTEEKWGEVRCNWCDRAWTCEKSFTTEETWVWYTSHRSCSCYDEKDRYREDLEGCGSDE